MNVFGFAGTFDPMTAGHVWMVNEGLQIADKVIIIISANPSKNPSDPSEHRKTVIESIMRDNGWADRTEVVIVRRDYTARAAMRMGVTRLIRGLRVATDFDYENLIQQTNDEVICGLKTIFFMPPRDLGAVNSSFVKSLAADSPVGWHWKCKRFLPAAAYQAMRHKWLKEQWFNLFHGHADSHAWFERLTSAEFYDGPSRTYHNLDHLVHGLTEIDVWAANTPDAMTHQINEVKKAFWFHDAIYKQKDANASDEELSAVLFETCQLSAFGGKPSDLIRATDHFQQSNIVHPLKTVMLGADLAILGQDEKVYDAYAQSIRLEYSDASDADYATGRKGAITHLLAKAKADELFEESYFSDLYNDAAIQNMTRELATFG